MQETLRRIIEAAEARRLPFLLIGGRSHFDRICPEHD
jgi:hypothetical protein